MGRLRLITFADEVGFDMTTWTALSRPQGWLHLYASRIMIVDDTYDESSAKSTKDFLPTAQMLR